LNESALPQHSEATPQPFGQLTLADEAAVVGEAGFAVAAGDPPLPAPSLPDAGAAVVESDCGGADDVPGADFADEYRSAYQPPPLRMKCVPPLISRCASNFMHLGHSTDAGSVMR
jgi:hypothetical protein